MHSRLFGDGPRSARYVTDSRQFSSKSAGYRPGIVTSSKSEAALKVRWKSGVLNLSFACEDDFSHSKSFGNDDVFSPVTSPTSDFYPGIYHKAVSRRQLQMDDDLNDESTSAISPPSGLSLSETEYHRMAIKSQQDTKRKERNKPAGRDLIHSESTFDSVSRSLDSNMAASAVSMNKVRSLGGYENVTDKEILTEGDENAELTLHPNKNEAVSRLSQHSVNKSLSDRNRNRTNSPQRKKTERPKSPENSQTSSPGYQTGIEAIIGESVPLSPISDSPSEIEGVETIFGPDTEMAEVVESRRTTASTSAAYSAAETSDYAKVPAPSGASRRRKSLLGTFFRVGLFTAKAKRKSAAHDDSQSSDVSSPPPANRRLVQRRVSRLEMNDPIEDVFSGIVFATMDNQSPSCDDTRDRDSSDGDEIEEDPDVIMQSYINQKTDDEEAFVFKGIDDGGSHDNDEVIDPKENELLLPEAECIGSDSTDRPLTSETDLR